jgi:RNA polymerase sigma factor (sigma-70 family)
MLAGVPGDATANGGGAIRHAHTLVRQPPVPPTAETGVSELVAHALAGSHEAWNALVDRYARLVWSVGHTFRLSDADTADVCQTTWLRLIEHLDRIADPERLGAWLATVARRECIAILRGRDREMSVNDFLRDGYSAPKEADPGPEAILVGRVEREQLLAQIDRMPGRMREVMRLRVANKGTAEIATELAMTESTVRVHLARARAQLMRYGD